MKKVILSMLIVCLTLTANARLTQWGAQSKVESHSLKSKALNAEREYTILLPKSYEGNPDRKYPILYLPAVRVPQFWKAIIINNSRFTSK